MPALFTVLADYRARQQRILQPLAAARIAGALAAVVCDWAILPLNVAAAAVAGYREAQAAVFTPGGKE